MNERLGEDGPLSGPISRMLDNPLNDLTQLLYPLSISFSSFLFSLISRPACTRLGQPFRVLQRQLRSSGVSSRDSQSQIDKEDVGDDEERSPGSVLKVSGRIVISSNLSFKQSRSDLSSFQPRSDLVNVPPE